MKSSMLDFCLFKEEKVILEALVKGKCVVCKNPVFPISRLFCWFFASSAKTNFFDFLKRCRSEKMLHIIISTVCFFAWHFHIKYDELISFFQKYGKDGDDRENLRNFAKSLLKKARRGSVLPNSSDKFFNSTMKRIFIDHLTEFGCRYISRCKVFKKDCQNLWRRYMRHSNNRFFLDNLEFGFSFDALQLHRRFNRKLWDMEYLKAFCD